MSPSVCTLIVPGDRGTACSSCENLPSSQRPSAEDLRPGRERQWRTLEAVEDLEAPYYLRTGLEDLLEDLSALVPHITIALLLNPES